MGARRRLIDRGPTPAPLMLPPALRPAGIAAREPVRSTRPARHREEPSAPENTLRGPFCAR